MIQTLLANPKLLLGLIVLVLFIVSVNWSLYSLVKDGHTFQEQSAKWGKAMQGGRQAAQRQQADLDELRRRVDELQARHDD